jgi:hypothetical protein
VAARPDVGEHHETHRIDSKSFALWLRGLYFSHCDEAVSDLALKDAIALLTARAVFAGPERHVQRRLVGDLDRVYVDLGDAAWRVVEVTANGWKVLDRAPVVFVRDNSALALPEPETGGTLETLRTLTNFASDPETRPPGLPRLADVTRFVTAAEKAIGWDVGSFQQALSENQATSLVESIEGSPYALAVVAFMETRKDWEGTSTQLLTLLSEANETAARQRTWPKAPAQATTELDRNAQVLLAHAIEYTRHREPGGNRHRVITLKKVQRDAGRNGTQPSDGENNPR